MTDDPQKGHRRVFFSCDLDIQNKLSMSRLSEVRPTAFRQTDRRD